MRSGDVCRNVFCGEVSCSELMEPEDHKTHREKENSLRKSECKKYAINFNIFFT